jgi:hypothetical protein
MNSALHKVPFGGLDYDCVILSLQHLRYNPFCKVEGTIVKLIYKKGNTLLRYLNWFIIFEPFYILCMFVYSLNI